MSNTARFWVVVSIVNLGQALAANRGNFSGPAIGFLAIAAAALIASFGDWPRNPTGATTILIACGLALALAQMAIHPPGLTLRITAAEYRRYLIALLCLCAVTALLWRPRWRRLWFPALAIAHVAMAAFTVRYAHPEIDVLTFQRDAARALLAGSNPYALTFPDPYYGKPLHFYGEGLAAGGRLLFGFPYPPLSLLLVLPASLAGDVRYAH